MILSFEGLQGSGKSTGAVGLAYEEHLLSGRKIISNDHLNLGPEAFTHFTLEYFLEHLVDTEMEDCIILWDEAYQMADSRSSATKINKLATYFAVQTRKRTVDLYICTHFLDHIDLRLRRAVDIRASCRTSIEEPCKKCKGEGTVENRPCDRCLGYGKCGTTRLNMLDRRLRRRYTIDLFSNKYWHLFSTKERIPLQARILQGIDVTEVG